MPQLTIPQDDGDDLTVDASDVQLPDGFQLMSKQNLDSDYVKKSFHKQELDNEVSRVSERFRNARLDELLEDEDVTQHLEDRFGGEVDDEEVKALQTRLKKLEEENEGLSSRVSKYERQAKGGYIHDHAHEAEIEDRFTKRVDGAPSYVEQMFADRLEEVSDGRYAVLDTDGNRIPAPSDSDRTYATLGDVLQQDKFDHLRSEPERNNGSGYKGSKGGGSKKWESMSTDEKIEAIQNGGFDAKDAPWKR